MQMPNKDGIEFLRDLHAQHDNYPPAVMITSERSMDVLEKAAEVGIKAFLLKPVDKERLQRGLKKIIDNLPIRMAEAPSTIPHGEVVPQALQQMLKEICNLDIQPEPEDESVRHSDVCFGTISIMGDVHWSVMLGFEQKAVAPIVSQFAGMEIPFDSPDLGDAVSELVNVVAGQAKRLLDEQNVQADISLPVVNVADRIRTIAQRSTTCEHRHFRSQLGRLWTSVTVGINTGLVL
jgi:CheY-specific phosphatase CheX